MTFKNTRNASGACFKDFIFEIKIKGIFFELYLHEITKYFQVFFFHTERKLIKSLKYFHSDKKI